MKLIDKGELWGSIATIILELFILFACIMFVSITISDYEYNKTVIVVEKEV